MALTRPAREDRRRHHGVAAGHARNQQAYPQNPAQQPGLGFPLVRVVVVFSLACGAVLGAALGRYQGKKTGENALLRTLTDVLAPGDVLLADRYYAGYFDLALWHARGVAAVVRKHQLRRTDSGVGHSPRGGHQAIQNGNRFSGFHAAIIPP